MVTLRINGTSRTVDVDPDTPLLWVLRDELRADRHEIRLRRRAVRRLHRASRRPSRALLRDAGRRGRKAATVSPSKGCRARSPRRCRPPGGGSTCAQCGYCQSGQIMSAIALLDGECRSRPTPTSTRR